LSMSESADAVKIEVVGGGSELSHWKLSKRDDDIRKCSLRAKALGT
jgi:hypothetical protein